jgi:ABC-type amino acid transport substrate-binding protein
MKVAHYITVIFLALFMGYVGARMAPSDNTAQTEIKKETAYERVLRTGVLRCGYAMWPPLVLNKDPNTGELRGIAKDIIETAAKNLSLKVEWTTETGWGDFPQGLNDGRFDVFCGTVWQSAAKARQIRYLSPMFYNPVYAYVRADDIRFDTGFKKLNDPQFKISGQDGEVSEFIAHNFFSKAKYVGQPQMSELGLIFMNVANKKADIVFNVPDIADDFMKNNPDTLKRVSSEPFMLSGTAYGVAMNEVNLQQMLDSAIIEMINNGTLNKILDDNQAPADQFLRVSQPYQTVNE